METLPAVSQTAVCDFCAASQVTNSYDVAPIRVELSTAIIHVVATQWTACHTCARLIEESQWEALTDRAVEAWRSREESAGAQIGINELQHVREDTARFHGGFRDARAKHTKA